MSILITGVNGFVGRHAVRHFLKETELQVFAFTRRNEHPLEHRRLTFFETDLHDTKAVNDRLRELKPTHVLHLAGQSSVSRSFQDPVATIRENLVMNLNLLDALRRGESRAKILLISSSEVYGPRPAGTLLRREEDPLLPESPYAASKAAVEMIAHQFAATYGLHIIIARPFNHTGPGQSDAFALSSFAKKLVHLKEPVITTGNLEAERDFLDVRDVVRAYHTLLDKGKPGGVYNVCSGKSRRLRQILEEMIGLVGRPVDIRTDPALERKVDIPILVGDPRKITAETGWTPAIEFSRTLQDLLDDWEKQLI